MSAHMTKLDAVNSLLNVIGELPITTLEDTLNADAVLAIRAIDDAVRDVLLEGWYFNTDHDVELTPDINGEIPLADNIIAIDADPLKARGVDIVQRGTKLYNKKNHSYVFDAPIKGVSVTYHLEFDELPVTFKQYVLAVTKLRFQSTIVGDSTLSSVLVQDAQRARIAVVAEEIRQSDRNLLDMNPNSTLGFSSFHNAMRR